MQKILQHISWGSVFLLVLLGLIWGSGYSIAHFATTHHVPSLGYALWQSVGPALFMLLIGLAYPKHRLSTDLNSLRFYALTGLFGIALPNSLMYLASPHLPAGLLAVIVNTVPIFTFVLATATHIEPFRLIRTHGVILCIVGLWLLIRPNNSLFSQAQTHWFWLILLVPLSFSAMALFSVRYRPDNASNLAIATGMLVFSSFFLSPITFYFHDFYRPSFPFHMQDGAILLEIILSSIGYVILFRILKMAGAIFYSLVGGIVAITGLFWGRLLFHEQLTGLEGIAVICIIAGVFLAACLSKANTQAS